MLRGSRLGIESILLDIIQLEVKLPMLLHHILNGNGDLPKKKKSKENHNMKPIFKMGEEVVDWA